MRLTKKNITPYLLDKGFLNPEWFISGSYSLTQTMSRNSIFKIQHKDSTGLFIKQLITQDSTNNYLMQKDATSHYLIHQLDLYKETVQYIPQYYGYDPNHQILVTEYYTNTKNIHEQTFISKELSVDYAKKIAEILASFHFDIRAHIDKEPSLQFFSSVLPWILNMDNLQATNKGLDHCVIKEIHSHPQLVKKIENLASQWQRTSLIHGDIKWMNFIVMPDKKEIKLIDWEIADIGDPLWDVAGAFQSYFSSWVMSFNNENQIHIKSEGTEFITIESITKVVGVLWDNYAKALNFTPQQKEDSLLKTLAYMGVRMIQTALESNFSKEKLSANTVRIIQFCDHILSDTKSIAKEWNLIE